MNEKEIKQANIERIMEVFGIERADAMLIVDIGNHAVEEAMSALMRVVKSAPDRHEPQVGIYATQALFAKLFVSMLAFGFLPEIGDPTTGKRYFYQERPHEQG